MKILITGCGGMLGEAVYPEMREGHEVHATDIDRNEKWLSYLDVRSPEDAEKVAEAVGPDAILHLAALTDLEYCELNPTHAYDVNFMGTHNMLVVAQKRDIPFVYISSAGVFDGTKLTYKEGDVPNPINVYAKSKYAGELACMAYPKSVIVRAGWMMGGGPLKDKKFVNKIIKQIRAMKETKVGPKELRVVADKLGTPTYTYEFAKMLRLLLEGNATGIYHGACDGGGSRVDVAWELVVALGLENEIAVRAVYSDYFKKEYFAKRPYSEKLVSSKLEPVVAWQDCLKDYLNRFEWGL